MKAHFTEEKNPSCEHHHSCGCGHHHHTHDTDHATGWLKWKTELFCLLLLLLTLCCSHYHILTPFWTTLLFVVAYLPVGLPVWKEAWEGICQKDFFNEFTLMTVASCGAFLIGEHAEGVAVMLFYSVGERLQDMAVHQARANINHLLDMRPDKAKVKSHDTWQTVDARLVTPGSIIQVCPGEKVPLDGRLCSDYGRFNTATLTGESTPQKKVRHEKILAGMINEEEVIEMEVTAPFEKSMLARILHLVEEAEEQKAPTERQISRWAHIYTPIVFGLAVAITFLPAMWMPQYHFSEWFYRALIFLVISCPCALVISVPLAYFSGIGWASRQGILFKGASFLDEITHLDTMVFDKTGTLTQGVFQVIESSKTAEAPEDLWQMAAALEAHSHHPTARAICAFSSPATYENRFTQIKEIPGKGISGTIPANEAHPSPSQAIKVTIGNKAVLSEEDLKKDEIASLLQRPETLVFITIENRYAGHWIIADKLKEQTADTIRELKDLGIKNTIILSGDRIALVEKIRKTLDMDQAYGELLPQDKMNKIAEIALNHPHMAYVGDGTNDAPALAASRIGIALGGMSSDAAIETADIVIQSENPLYITQAIRIGKATKKIVAQNVTGALSIKIIIMGLGAWGMASMWEAVFADVGVALLAILNSIRLILGKSH